MELKKLLDLAEKFISILIIIVTCILFSISIYTLLSSIVLADAITNDLIFQLTNQFLQSALLFIIGLEIALTLVKHSFVNVIELLIFAMVRKILLASESSLDVVLVVLSIIALILVRNYIKKETLESLLRES
ncbi:hypothetical protein HYG87_05410 [Methanobacterium alkalithermotolerans]|uniref:Phosphate-starvation-inducible E n=1 Tax=Methanobacterium alkalithermotolerans TaxID=2731220 RepID=A0A8T8K7Z2_9EURY|nr:hypothetical protein [Methanobacterium alkalithermotolerans]QUH23243.1 hypothetical protein HYG87_05410 [Methanobacterium alkalithermotolerans]